MVRLTENTLRNQFIIPAAFKKIIEEIAHILKKPTGDVVKEGALDFAALLSTHVAESIVKDEVDGADIEQKQVLALVFQRRLNFGLNKPLIDILMETPDILLKSGS